MVSKKPGKDNDDWGEDTRKIRVGKTALVMEISSRVGISKIEAGRAVDAFIDSITLGVKKGSVTLPGLGTFSVVKTKARTGVKPGTKESISIAAGKRLKFKKSSKLEI